MPITPVTDNKIPVTFHESIECFRNYTKIFEIRRAPNVSSGNLAGLNDRRKRNVAVPYSISMVVNGEPPNSGLGGPLYRPSPSSEIV